MELFWSFLEKQMADHITQVGLKQEQAADKLGMVIAMLNACISFRKGNRVARKFDSHGCPVK